MPITASDSDDCLLKGIQNGDETALVALFEKYECLMMGLVKKELLPHAAYAVEDVYAEARAAIIIRLNKNSHGIHNLKAWIGTVTWSKCKDFWRNTQRYHDLKQIMADISKAIADEQSPDECEYEEIVWELVKKLGPKYIKVAKLRTQGLWLSDIAIVLEIPENTAKSRWYKIRRTILERFPKDPTTS